MNPHPQQLRRAIAVLQGLGADPRMLEDDAWRTGHGYYGALAWPMAADGQPTVLLLGARSGLEAQLQFMRCAETRVIVVEPFTGRNPVLSGLRRLWPNLQVVSDVAAARGLLAGRAPDLVRVDGTRHTLDELRALLEGTRCGHLCGVFTDAWADPIALYRLSRDELARSFFWRDDQRRHSFGSDRGPAAVEVSVVVPAYKVSAWLDECLDSLASQTLERLEVIVVNDGSPDDTGDVADGWAARFPGRIQVIHKQNGGCASARNAGLAAARGEFVGFADGDDWVDPAMFAELYRAAILSGADVAQCGYAEAWADGSYTSHRGAPEGIGDWPHVTEDTVALLTERPTIWRRIYRRDMLAQNGIIFPDHVARFDDLPFQFEALLRARRVAMVPEAWYFYRQGRPGQTIGVRDERLYVHFPIFDWIWERVMPSATARVEAQFQRVVMNTHAWAMEMLLPEHRAGYRALMRAQMARQRLHLGRLDLLRLGLRAGRLGIVGPSLVTKGQADAA
ncbi:glycosyltransferase [Rhodovarius crocodyli]|uniref:Glycosyltransferase n=1 Tax=Rhodovarius crocodyli TaxID=1979269 RepID=A0A437MIR8_9PROT|nr:glycosyltransferase [Rhodovarius crocodyli]RVT97535.1 glycosyltransferase [Rhodovarius crocodyli]